MKYLVAFLLSVGVATASDFGTAHDIVLFGEQSIAAGQTNTVETAYKVRGLVRQGIVYQDGAGVSTTTVAVVRGDFARTVAAIAANDAAAVSSAGFFPAYDEIIRFTTVNYGTNTITVIPAIIYEK